MSETGNLAVLLFFVVQSIDHRARMGVSTPIVGEQSCSASFCCIVVQSIYHRASNEFLHAVFGYRNRDRGSKNLHASSYCTCHLRAECRIEYRLLHLGLQSSVTLAPQPCELLPS